MTLKSNVDAIANAHRENVRSELEALWVGRQPLGASTDNDNNNDGDGVSGSVSGKSKSKNSSTMMLFNNNDDDIHSNLWKSPETFTEMMLELTKAIEIQLTSLRVEQDDHSKSKINYEKDLCTIKIEHSTEISRLRGQLHAANDSLQGLRISVSMCCVSLAPVILLSVSPSVYMSTAFSSYLHCTVLY